MEDFLNKNIQRVIQESVPGKQITIAHIIASPMPDIYERLGIDDKGALSAVNDALKNMLGFTVAPITRT